MRHLTTLWLGHISRYCPNPVQHPPSLESTPSAAQKPPEQVDFLLHRLRLSNY